MNKINAILLGMQVKMLAAVSELKNSERGDTNFVSMLLIIGIVVVLAGAFLTLANGAMGAIASKVNGFISSL